MSTYIIAEVGVNHNGDINIAKKLIKGAKCAGADAVKFQTWITEDIIDKKANKAEYQKETNKDKETQFEMLKKLEFSFNQFVELKEFCESIKIEFLSTPDDINCAKFLDSIQNKFKIGSGEINNLLFLKQIAKLGKPVIISTGISNLNEVKNAIEALKEGGLNKTKITLMHVTSEYPAPISEVNLKAMVSMKNKFNCEVGYSDHTEGNEVAMAAVALGAKIIEKHITLDKNMKGPDHSSSCTPKEFNALVRSIRKIELALGQGTKIPTDSEIKNKEIIRKKIFYKSNFIKGHKLTENDLLMMRSSIKNLIPANEYKLILGKELVIDVKALSPIKKGEFS